MTSKARSPKRTWDISQDRWRSLGLHKAMSLTDAKARTKQLNAILHIQRQELLIQTTKDNELNFRTKNLAVLPDEFVQEFELLFIHSRGILTDEQKKRRIRRRYVTWRASQRLIVAIGQEPSDWFYKTHEFYEYFYQQQLSLGYIYSILKLANLWGHFMSRKLGRPFLPVPRPSGYERSRLIEAYYLNPTNKNRASLPLTPGDLNKVKSKLIQKSFNWLFLSIWFGLRPMEIDSLENPKMWSLELRPTGEKVLWIFQTKIIATPIEERWKPIPILYHEQKFALKIIESQMFKRPLTKSIQAHLGAGYTLYGGRKGFVDLMLSKGNSLENISIWMGHSNLNRTWKSYKNKRVYHL